MAQELGRHALDGGWWPRSRDLSTELAQLVDQFPAELGRITQVLVSPADWDHRPDTVRAGHGIVDVATLPPDEAHLVTLATSAPAVLRVLVVPPDYTDDQGDEALLAAATHGNVHSTTDLLDTVTEHPDVDRRDLWSTGG